MATYVDQIQVSYAGFKVAKTTLGTMIYYSTWGAGYQAVLVGDVTDQASITCIIDQTADIADFETNLIPSATEVIGIEDAIALVPIGGVPPTP